MRIFKRKSRLTMPSYSDMRSYRQELNLSLREVSQKTSVLPGTISRIENGKNCNHSYWIELFHFYKSMGAIS